MTGAEAPLARSRQDIQAAQSLISNGFPIQAVSRAYYAAFYAADAALTKIGETRSKHSGIIAAFGQLIVSRGEVDVTIGRLLRSLFDRRMDADYGSAEASLEAAREAIGDAERFVDAVEAWLVTKGQNSV